MSDEFRRPPTRFRLVRANGYGWNFVAHNAPSVAECATLADVVAALRAWFPDPTMPAFVCMINSTQMLIYDGPASTGELLATLTEVFE